MVKKFVFVNVRLLVKRGERVCIKYFSVQVKFLQVILVAEIVHPVKVKFLFSVAEVSASSVF